MAELKASEVKYGVPSVSKVGDLLFTVTTIEFPASAEYVEGGVELKPKNLGLTVEAINGAQSVSRLSEVGETATTSGLGGAIWCDPLAVKAKEANEESKQVAEAALAQVTLVKGKPFLRVFGLETAGIGKPLIETKTATKQVIGLFTTTVYCLGK